MKTYRLDNMYEMVGPDIPGLEWKAERYGNVWMRWVAYIDGVRYDELGRTEGFKVTLRPIGGGNDGSFG